MAPPTDSEVLAWMVRLDRTAADAVDHFWPTAIGDERQRLRARVKQWASRARRAGRPDAPPSRTMQRAETSDTAGGGDGELPERPAPDYELARLSRLEFLEHQLAELLADLAWVRSAKHIGRVAALNAQVSEVRSQLDLARAQAGTVVALDRSAAAVAEEVLRRQARIAELAARAPQREL